MSVGFRFILVLMGMAVPAMAAGDTAPNAGAVATHTHEHAEALEIPKGDCPNCGGAGTLFTEFVWYDHNGYDCLWMAWTCDSCWTSIRITPTCPPSFGHYPPG